VVCVSDEKKEASGIILVDIRGDIDVSVDDFEAYLSSISEDRRESIRDRYVKGKFNPDYYGVITISADGVFSDGKKIKGATDGK